jgi:hypothetical protein
MWMTSFVILEKALVKVKVPVRLDSGKIVMGYRYKRTGDLNNPFQKKKKVLLKDLKYDFDYLFDNNAIELKLLDSDTIYRLKNEFLDKVEYKEKKASAVYKKRLEKLRQIDDSREIPFASILKKTGERAIEKSLKKAGIITHKQSRDWQDGWALHANNHGDSTSDILQFVMSKRLPKGTYAESHGVAALLRSMKVNIKYGEKYEKESDKIMLKAADVVLDTIYSRTQSILKNMGYSPDDSIFLYRGMSSYRLKSGKVYSFKNFKSNPLSSWSINPDTAMTFGNKVLITKVKVKDIFSVYLTGFGCREESEVVLPSTAIGYFKVLK